MRPLWLARSRVNEPRRGLTQFILDGSFGARPARLGGPRRPAVTKMGQPSNSVPAVVFLRRRSRCKSGSEFGCITRVQVQRRRRLGFGLGPEYAPFAGFPDRSTPRPIEKSQAHTERGLDSIPSPPQRPATTRSREGVRPLLLQNGCGPALSLAPPGKGWSGQSRGNPPLHGLAPVPASMRLFDLSKSILSAATAAVHVDRTPRRGAP